MVAREGVICGEDIQTDTHMYVDGQTHLHVHVTCEGAQECMKAPQPVKKNVMLYIVLHTCAWKHYLCGRNVLINTLMCTCTHAEERQNQL